MNQLILHSDCVVVFWVRIILCKSVSRKSCSLLYYVRGVSLENLSLLILLLFSYYFWFRFWFQFLYFDFQNFSFWFILCDFWFLQWFFDFQNFIVWFLEWFFDFQNFIVWFFKWNFDFKNLSLWFLLRDFDFLSVFFFGFPKFVALISKMRLDFSKMTFDFFWAFWFPMSVLLIYLQNALISKMRLLICKWRFDFQNETFDFANGVLISKMRLLISQMAFWFPKWDFWFRKWRFDFQNRKWGFGFKWVRFSPRDRHVCGHCDQAHGRTRSAGPASRWRHTTRKAFGGNHGWITLHTALVQEGTSKCRTCGCVACSHVGIPHFLIYTWPYYKTCMLRRRTRSNLAYSTDTRSMKGAGMAHIAILVFVIQLHFIYMVQRT